MALASPVSPSTPLFDQTADVPAHNIISAQASDSLELLANAAIARENIHQDSCTQNAKTDEDDAESPCPTFDRFYNECGAEIIAWMINFSPDQFESLWSDLEELFRRTQNVGRRYRTKVTEKDALITLLTIMKLGGQL